MSNAAERNAERASPTALALWHASDPTDQQTGRIGSSTNEA